MAICPKPNKIQKKKQTDPGCLYKRGGGAHGPPPSSGQSSQGPEHREFNELPALGTAPETQKARSNLEIIGGPRRMFQRLAHSLNQEHSRGDKTRQRQTYSIPYRYRRHEAHHRRHRPNTETRRSGCRRAPRGGGRTQPASCATRAACT